MHGETPTKTAATLGGDISAALEQVHVPAFILDRHGTTQWANARATALFGELRGRPFTEPIAPEAVAKARTAFAKKVLGAAKTTDYDSVLLRPNGERVPVEIHTVALSDGGYVVGVFGIVDVKAVRPAPAPSLAPLTPRQQEVLCQLARGCSTAQMAATLGVSPETIRNHVRAILRALRVHSRLEAVAEAHRRGLVA
jgi:PAS domain S-box-containing protein